LKKSLFFVADFFEPEFHGGGEKNDKVLIDHLRKFFNVRTVKSSEMSVDCRDDKAKYIISNFVGLSEENKEWLISSADFVIFEHDHKYISSRDPSIYRDFLIPRSEIVNERFYNAARKVVCLSKLHAEVLQKNLPDAKVTSIGTSLWSSEELTHIWNATDWWMADDDGNFKNGWCAILDSKNSIKQTQKAVEFCKTNNIKFRVIPPMPWKELIREIAPYESLCFFPKVLESFSRIVVEAKMLGLKILTTPKKLGAASEPWFNLSGKELQGIIRTRVNEALESFRTIFEDEEEEKKEIIAILNVYRRPELLQEQVNSLLAQTVKPKEIWVWVNHHDDNKNFDFESVTGVDKWFKNSTNWKYNGRFSAALLTDEEQLIALFDDDTIPGSRWFENCLNHWQEDRILGGVGCILKGKIYQNHDRVGWSNPNEELTQVDLAGHAWFFGREALRSFWLVPMFSTETGEDIHLSYASQTSCGIQTFVPPHPKDQKELWSSLKGYEYGVDEVASSNPKNHQNFYALRNAIVKNYWKNGWKLQR